MVRVNKKYLEKDLTIKAWNKFLTEIGKVNSPETVNIKMRDFLTPSEIIMLEKRLAIPILLDKKLSYKTIGQILDVSPTTISFVKHNLTKKAVTHKKYSQYRRPSKQLSILPPRSHHRRWLMKKLEAH